MGAASSANASPGARTAGLSAGTRRALGLGWDAPPREGTDARLGLHRPGPQPAVLRVHLRVPLHTRPRKPPTALPWHARTPPEHPSATPGALSAFGACLRQTLTASDAVLVAVVVETSTVRVRLSGIHIRSGNLAVH